MECDFNKVPGTINRYECARDDCLGHVETDVLPIRRRCNSGRVTTAPARVRQIFNFTKAAIAHALRGSPTCSQLQIDERLAVCLECEDFTGRHCRHCGCKCSDVVKYLNKLAWADQECPIGKWAAKGSTES